MENKFGKGEKIDKSLMITGAPATGKTTLIRKISELENVRLTPDHTTRDIRPDEVNGIDKVFLTVEQFISNFNLDWYLEPDLDFAYFNGNYYGTPISWIDDVNDGGEKIAFISVSVEIARKIKLAVKDNILWVHLVASDDQKQTRLAQRNIVNTEIEKRLNGGDSQGFAQGADIMIDTSTVSIEQALKIIRDELYGK